MAEEAPIWVHRLKAGGVVAVRRQEDKAAMRQAFVTRVTVAETATEVAWTSQPPLVLVIEERDDVGRATVYKFETTESGLKLFVEVVAAIVLDAAEASKKGSGEGNGGTPPVPRPDIRLPARPDEKRPQPSVWYDQQKVKAKNRQEPSLALAGGTYKE